MKLMTVRALEVGGLIVLYQLNPVIGVAALMVGFAYVLHRQLRPRRVSAS